MDHLIDGRGKRIVLGYEAIVGGERKVFEYKLESITPTRYTLEDGSTKRYFLIVDVPPDHACGFHALGFFGDKDAVRDLGSKLLQKSIEQHSESVITMLAQAKQIDLGRSIVDSIPVAQQQLAIIRQHYTDEKHGHWLVIDKTREGLLWGGLVALAAALGVNLVVYKDGNVFCRWQARTVSDNTLHVLNVGNNHYQILIPTTETGEVLVDHFGRTLPEGSAVDKVRSYLTRMHEHVQRKLQEVGLIGITEASTDRER